MECPKCGSKTSVIGTRTNASQHVAKHGAYVRHVSDAVSWYTGDWVARRRRCTNCRWSEDTVELLIKDLNNGWSRKE